MSGIIGRVGGGGSIQRMLGTQAGEGDLWEHERGDVALAARGEPLDPASLHVLAEGTRSGVVYGAISNRPELGFEDEELVEVLLDRPSETAAALEGDFLVAVHDGSAGRLLLISDKLGSRGCFYTTTAPFLFATSVEAVVAALPDATLDEQGASDLVLMGHLWGDRTLVSEVKSLRPATVLEVETGSSTYTTTRYWRPSYDTMQPGEAYLSELVERYYQSFERVQTTLPDSVGLWLSGGLDSRTTASAFVETGDQKRLTGYVYNANPPTNDNPRIARRIARKLDIGLE